MHSQKAVTSRGVTELVELPVRERRASARSRNFAVVLQRNRTRLMVHPVRKLDPFLYFRINVF